MATPLPDLLARAKVHWELACASFAGGDATEGWVQLLAMSMCTAAIEGKEQMDLISFARAGGLIADG